MNKKPFIILFFTSCVALLQMGFKVRDKDAVSHTVDYISSEALVFSSDALHLYDLVKTFDTINAEHLTDLKSSLKTCRNEYKKIAFFLEYFFPSEAHVFNAARTVEVEDAELEFIEPMGLQQIEKLLYQPDPTAHREELLLQCESLYTSASDIRSLLFNFSASDAQVLESLRIELIRICTLYITGYDAPELKTGINEAHTAIIAIRYTLVPYLPGTNDAGRALDSQLAAAAGFLAWQPDFNSFSRMKFLKLFGLPLQHSLAGFISALHLDLNSSEYLNYNVQNIFDKRFLDGNVFNDVMESSNGSVNLGKMLFSETALSSTKKRSCSTCHKPDLYFTDGVPKSALLNAHGTMKRNAPTLLYSGTQHAFFWDGRANTLQGLIKTVLLNAEEMNGNESDIKSRLKRNPVYRGLFKKVFPEIPPDLIGLNEIASCIAVYLQTLTPMNAAFDRYIQGDSTAMNSDQIKGFDLFMGKARCATCHFPPLFNALLPPYYDVSEYEIIGATRNQDLRHSKKDNDRGRFNSFPVAYYDGAFKTPTVRNAAKTAPYMHNGAFRSLDSVIAFYNKGGGEGVGVSTPLQTLSPEPLHLSAKESYQLNQFIHSLTDTPITHRSQKNLKQSS